MADLLAALGLALAIEGILYAVFPEQMKRMITQVLGQPDTVLRTVGLAAALLGVGLVWIVRG